MIRTALCAAIFAIGIVEAAWGQDYWSVPSSSDPDDLEIRASSEGHFAEIHYSNAAAMSSTSGTHVLTWRDEITGEVADITVMIQVGGQDVDGREIIRITPPDYLVADPDYAEVPDGEELVIQIQRAMF